MSVLTYYDKDCNIENISEETIAVIGYGIQGRAYALNLRDSGLKVVVGNRKDSYFEQARHDGFDPSGIEEAAKKASTIIFLVPDQAQKEIYERYIKNNLKPNDLIVFAHGYSLHFKRIILPLPVDVVLLAPRMPGKIIRKYYLEDSGVPAFFDVFRNSSGKAKERGLALAKAMGFTRNGVMHVNLGEETEIDLFIEQFLIPSIIETMKISFQTMVDNGFTPEAVLMELYASGEIGEVLLEASRVGLYEVFRKNASPTCQFGIQHNRSRVVSQKSRDIAKVILNEIKNGTFSKLLEKEARAGYPELSAYNKKTSNDLMAKTHHAIRRVMQYPYEGHR